MHQVVAEYERAVIFRLGRLRKGGAKGPGIFFVIPCIDSYQKVDLRTVSFDVPPQEVKKTSFWGFFLVKIIYGSNGGMTGLVVSIKKKKFTATSEADQTKK